jgi:multidrug efflux system membrane fusion protein
MDGVAGVMQVHPGSTVKANDTALLVINQIQPIYASFSVPEARLGQLKVATAKGPIQVFAEVPGSKIPIKGQVAVIDNGVDVSTGTILVKAQFPNENNMLTPGQFVNISLVIDRIDHALIVPTSAVQIGPAGNFVFVVKADRSVEIRPVTAGVSLSEETVVSSGISPGETVVTDGQARLKAGVKVELFAQGDRLTPASAAGETAASYPSDSAPTATKSPAAP